MALLVTINCFLIFLAYLVKVFVETSYLDENLLKNTLGQQKSYAGVSF